MLEKKRGLKGSPPATAISIIALLMLPALLCFVTAKLYAGFVSLTGALVKTVDAAAALQPEETEDEPVTFLLFGIDAGEWVGGSYRAGVGRADTIVLIQTDPGSGKASLLSIPRDTLVVIPGRPGDDKINHSYAFGRAPLLVETVEIFTGIEVDHYVGLNYIAFKDVVDLLGGVDFEVDRAIDSRGLHLEPGLQHLDGDMAFAVVSTRKDPMGDIARVRRQQRFIKTVAGAAKERSLDDLFYIMLAAWDNIDTDISIPGALALRRKLSGITEKDMAMEIVPGWFYNRGGISYWKPNLLQTEQIIQRLFQALPPLWGATGVSSSPLMGEDRACRSHDSCRGGVPSPPALAGSGIKP